MINLSNKIIKAEHVRVIDAGKNRMVRSETADSPSGVKGRLLNGKEEKTENNHHTGISQTLIDELKKEAYESGFAAGINEGKNQQLQEFTQTIQAIEQSVKELNDARSKIWKESEQDILKLAFMIAEKILHREVSLDRTVVIDVVKNAVSCIRDKNDVTIRLNPRDYDFIAETNPDFLSAQGLAESFILERDDQIRPGGAVVETGSTEIDARLDQQIEMIIETLTAS